MYPPQKPTASEAYCIQTSLENGTSNKVHMSTGIMHDTVSSATDTGSLSGTMQCAASRTRMPMK